MCITSMIKMVCIRVYDFMSQTLSSLMEKLIESHAIIIFTLVANSGQTLLYEKLYFKVSWGNTIETNVFRIKANVRADAIT